MGLKTLGGVSGQRVPSEVQWNHGVKRRGFELSRTLNPRDQK